jgi:hypothetical protein
MSAKLNKMIIIYGLFVINLVLFQNCSNSNISMPSEDPYKIIFLHHSTGEIIWKGSSSGNIFKKSNAVADWFARYNSEKQTNYFITEQAFPKEKPYGWANYPYDYYTIWVKNAGENPYMEEPTLEMLTKEYKLIIFKHCFPVGYIEENAGNSDIGSKTKSLEVYKLQYTALKEKLKQFPDTKFILWTAPALARTKTTPEYAGRTKQFVDWVIKEWDGPNDNIFLWNFYDLETKGGLYLTDENARNPNDSHPCERFASNAATLFCQRIIDIIETNGQKTTLTGEFLN